MKYLPILILFGLLSFIPSESFAQERNQPFIKITRTPELSFPLNCTPTQDCWVINYVDIGPDDGDDIDHTCGPRTYDGHKGTDIAILDGMAIKIGVPVLAVKDGTVKRVRDGEPDKWASEDDLEEIKEMRKECGNAVLIDHGDGLETIYCHMRKGSITVKPRQKVKQGDKLGKVGLSGYTQFPHIHLGIIRDGKIIDPYTGLSHEAECGQKKQAWWKKDIGLTYQPLTLMATGLTNTVPELNNLLKDMAPPKSIPPNSEALLGWALLYGVQEDDQITLEIFDPNNRSFHRQDITQDSNRARQFYYTGRNLKEKPLSEGVYTIKTTVLRPATADKIEQKWSKTDNLLVIQP